MGLPSLPVEPRTMPLLGPLPIVRSVESLQLAFDNEGEGACAGKARRVVIIAIRTVGLLRTVRCNNFQLILTF